MLDHFVNVVQFIESIWGGLEWKFVDGFLGLVAGRTAGRGRVIDQVLSMICEKPVMGQFVNKCAKFSW